MRKKWALLPAMVGLLSAPLRAEEGVVAAGGLLYDPKEILVSVDASSRLKPAIARFEVKNLTSRLLEWAEVRCEFHNQNGNVAGWGKGGISYVEPNEVVTASVIAPKITDAVSAKCGIVNAHYR